VGHSPVWPGPCARSARRGRWRFRCIADQRGNHMTTPSSFVPSWLHSFGRRRGFALIESFFVIAMIAFLATVLFPVFHRARLQEPRVSGVEYLHMRQIALALATYAAEYDEFLPPNLNEPLVLRYLHPSLADLVQQSEAGRRAGPGFDDPDRIR